MEETEVLFCTFYFLGKNSLGKKGHRKTLGLHKVIESRDITPPDERVCSTPAEMGSESIA